MIAEELIYFIWQFRLFDQFNLRTQEGEELRILEVGQANNDAGPDFLFARLTLDGKEWHGHIEIHRCAQDWLKHKHMQDEGYNAVVLHVIWSDYVPCYRQDQSMLPTLLMQPLVGERLLQRYRRLMRSAQWLSCSAQVDGVTDMVKSAWLQRMAVERLADKNQRLLQLLGSKSLDWEQVMFVMLARSFGMQVNAEAFMALAQRINLSILRRYQHDALKVEALCFGQAGFLTLEQIPVDYYQRLRQEYKYLQHVHSLVPMAASSWKFMRMRPYNFPTFRLAQWVGFLLHTPSLFGWLHTMDRPIDVYQALQQMPISPFWNTHFTFYKTSSLHSTSLSRSFIDHLFINCFAVVLFSYGKYMDVAADRDRALAWLEALRSEHNAVVRAFKRVGFASCSAADSQGIIQLKNEYCQHKRCLHCAIGLSILQR